MPDIKQKNIGNNLIDLLLDNKMDCIIEDLYKSENGNDYFDLSYSDPSKISYLKGDRIPENTDLIYDKDYREGKAYHSKIGKLLSDKIDNSVIQKISAIMSARKTKNEYVLKLTTDICYYYLEDNYANDRGVLGSSCMRSSGLQDAISFYENIGKNKVELLVAVDNNNKLVGRALLWHNVTSGNKKIDYLDRIYTNNDNLKELFIIYASEHNILLRDDNCNNLQINIDIDRSQALPYFDTFQGYELSGYLSNCGGDVSLESTEGLCLDDLHNPYECQNCGSSLCEDEAYYSEWSDCYLCCDCGAYVDSENDFLPDSQIVYIDNVAYNKESDQIIYSDYENEYILIDDSCYSEYENEYFKSGNEDFIYSENAEDYILKSNCIYSEYENDYFLADCVNYSKMNDDYYKIEDVVFSKFHNDYILLDDAVHIDFMDDYFLQDDDCIYYSEEDQEHKHKQYILAV